jgi:hypothetical protein
MSLKDSLAGEAEEVVPLRAARERRAGGQPDEHVVGGTQCERGDVVLAVAVEVGRRSGRQHRA